MAFVYVTGNLPILVNKHQRRNAFSIQQYFYHCLNIAASVFQYTRLSCCSDGGTKGKPPLHLQCISPLSLIHCKTLVSVVTCTVKLFIVPYPRVIYHYSNAPSLLTSFLGLHIAKEGVRVIRGISTSQFVDPETSLPCMSVYVR
jgi:hypothetical protein